MKRANNFKKQIILFLCIILWISCCYAFKNPHTVEQKNIFIVKQMFANFAEKLDLKKLDTYYTRSFVLESNGKFYNYTAYKKLEHKIYKNLKKLKVTKYDDIFAVKNKVVSRMTIKLTHNNGKSDTFQVILIALIKDNKIDRIWELTYPGWSKKLVK